MHRLLLICHSFQEIHLCLDGKVWKWCEPFEIGKAGSFVRGVKSADHHYTVIVRVSKLSNVQNQVKAVYYVGPCLYEHN